MLPMVSVLPVKPEIILRRAEAAATRSLLASFLSAMPACLAFSTFVSISSFLKKLASLSLRPPLTTLPSSSRTPSSTTDSPRISLARWMDVSPTASSIIFCLAASGKAASTLDTKSESSFLIFRYSLPFFSAIALLSRACFLVYSFTVLSSMPGKDKSVSFISPISFPK